VIPRRPGGLQFVISMLRNVGIWYTPAEKSGERRNLREAGLRRYVPAAISTPPLERGT